MATFKSCTNIFKLFEIRWRYWNNIHTNWAAEQHFAQHNNTNNTQNDTRHLYFANFCRFWNSLYIYPEHLIIYVLRFTFALTSFVLGTKKVCVFFSLSNAPLNRRCHHTDKHPWYSKHSLFFFAQHSSELK